MIAVSNCFGQALIKKELPLFNVLTDQEITIDAFASSKALVLIFTSIHCPYSKLYKQRVSDLSDQYANQNVRFVLINASANHPSNRETLAQMKNEASLLNKQLIYCADQQLLLKNALNVEKNPEAIILMPGAAGYQKVYQGAIDDSPQSASLASKNYLQTALDNLLAGQAISPTYQRPVGCRIR